MKSKTAIAASLGVSLIQTLIGVPLLILFVPMTLMAIFGAVYAPTEVIIFCFIMDVVGVKLVTSARKKRRLVRKFRRYVDAISANPSGSISQIADSLGVSRGVALEDLGDLIEKEFFSNASIDFSADRIAIPGVTYAAASVREAAPAAGRLPPAETVTVKCRKCGGLTTIEKGAEGECDYCGSPIRGE